MTEAQVQGKIGLVENEKKYQDYIIGRLREDPKVGSIELWESAEVCYRDLKTGSLDILFVDIMLPQMNGVELVRMLSEKYNELKMVMISNMTSEKLIFDSLKAGALGYIYKAELEGIVDVASQIMNGGAIISPTIALHVLENFKKPADIRPENNLSERERQVLELLVSGIPPKDIGGTLQISIDTTRNHIKKIYKKLNVNSKVEMMRRASDLGFF
jgi:DNA-binding NarL/FixJ family response regulator